MYEAMRSLGNTDVPRALRFSMFSLVSRPARERQTRWALAAVPSSRDRQHTSARRRRRLLGIMLRLTGTRSNRQGCRRSGLDGSMNHGVNMAMQRGMRICTHVRCAAACKLKVHNVRYIRSTHMYEVAEWTAITGCRWAGGRAQPPDVSTIQSRYLVPGTRYLLST